MYQKLDFNSKVVGTQPPQTEPNNVETILSRFKNVIGDDEPVKEQENGLEIEDEIMLSPVSLRDNKQEELVMEEKENVEMEPIQKTSRESFPTGSSETSKNPEKRKLQCKLCPETFAKRKQLVRHLVEHKENFLSLPKPNITKNETDFATKNFSDISGTHGNSLTEESCKDQSLKDPKFSVNDLEHVKPECSVPMENREAMSITDENIKESKPEELKCNECDRTFSTKRYLQNHSTIHTGDKPFVCQICQKGFTQKSNMNFHTRKFHNTDENSSSIPAESSENPTEISSKKRTLDNADDVQNPKSLKRLRVDKELETLECKQCPKTFKSKPTLKIHTESIHEGIRHSCDTCNYEAITVATLKLHIQSVHEGITYPCDLCDFVSKHKSNLINHTKKKHPNTK